MSADRKRSSQRAAETKEKSQAKRPGFRLSNLFPGSAAAGSAPASSSLVPLKPLAPLAPRNEVTSTSLASPANASSQETKVMRSDLAQTRTQPLPPPPVVDPSFANKTRVTSASYQPSSVLPKRQPKSDRSGWLLIIPALALATYALMDTSNMNSDSAARSQRPVMSQAELQERVDFHRKMTGWKLNRERVDVQLDNLATAPQLPEGARKIASPDMMGGLPLIGESHPLDQKVETPHDVNPTYPDARIMYGLQEEQDRLAWEKKADAAYLKDLKLQADKQGYELKVDEEGNVFAIPASNRGPSSFFEEPESANAGATSVNKSTSGSQR